MDPRIKGLVLQRILGNLDIECERNGIAILSDIVELVVLRLVHLSRGQASLCGRARPNVFDFSVSVSALGFSIKALLSHLGSLPEKQDDVNEAYREKCIRNITFMDPEQVSRHYYDFFPNLPPEYTFKNTAVFHCPAESISKVAFKKAIQQKEVECSLYKLLETKQSRLFINYE